MKKLFCIISILIGSSIFVGGCKTTDPIDQPLPPVTFQKEKEYVLDLSKIKQPDAPNFIFLVMDQDGKLRTAKPNEKPQYVAMLQEDLTKIDAMLDVKNAYRNIAKEQEALINVQIEKANVLKEMMALERQNREFERQLRIDLEKRYNREVKDHRIDNIINRATFIATIVGGVAICAL